MVTTSVQRVKIINKEKIKRANHDYILLTYTRLTGDDAGKEKKSGNFLSALVSSIEVLKVLKPGDECNITKEKKGDYWNITSIDMGDAPVVKDRGEYKAKSTNNSGTFDNVGVKVGAARNQAIAFLAATRGKDFTLDDVDAIAFEVVTRQQKQEDAVRNGTTTTTKVETPAVKPTVAKVESDDFDVDF